eukprot:SAG31_NODE_4828_length_2921_cov_1.564139_3_plen_167_part_00
MCHVPLHAASTTPNHFLCTDDLHVDNASCGDRWLNQMQPIAAKQPYMVSMGNHESIYDGLNYRKRFTMPFFNVTHNLWYSWDHGNTHWLSYTGEAYFEVTDRRYPELGREHWGPWPEWVAAQREFIESDLVAAAARRDSGEGGSVADRIWAPGDVLLGQRVRRDAG